MSNQPQVTRITLPNGKNRYMVNGSVHTKQSSRVFTHASVYEFVRLSEYDKSRGRKVGDRFVFFHARLDSAVKGNPVANNMSKSGDWARRGVVEIVPA